MLVCRMRPKPGVQQRRAGSGGAHDGRGEAWGQAPCRTGLCWKIMGPCPETRFDDD